jgi:hypothetical protein
MLKFLSSLVLPLMLGIFTVVITFEQQKVARQQRLEDKHESRLQREQEWNISQIAIAAQNQGNIDWYRNEVVVVYAKEYVQEIGDLLKENNGSLTSNSLAATLARIKTLDTIRQTDGSRQANIIHFLYEAGQLTNTNETTALDISRAERTNTDFGKLSWILMNGRISLAGVFLTNYTLSHIKLQYINFSSTRLHSVSFSSAHLKEVHFSSTRLNNVDFSSQKNC